ncbi:hypothetical protein CXG81DRAFT_24380 [Caulochytrium protostelioides]|uniref:ARM repeat-containing protein n=1 Tax=Caulochytrium protostelioides TaxID=1555241 RepID=A0A4P9XC05_9FUNG|nr:hypothetical protein CXG81DRAFT_24380 [Caulochytrium protostelioides]|eukprot:RKP02974.1 hypothetical protein CXG81DRAFT_24380 [Caulochytrium protostelioides]
MDCFEPPIPAAAPGLDGPGPGAAGTDAFPPRVAVAPSPIGSRRSRAETFSSVATAVPTAALGPPGPATAAPAGAGHRHAFGDLSTGFPPAGTAAAPGAAAAAAAAAARSRAGSFSLVPTHSQHGAGGQHGSAHTAISANVNAAFGPSMFASKWQPADLSSPRARPTPPELTPTSQHGTSRRGSAASTALDTALLLGSSGSSGGGSCSSGGGSGGGGGFGPASPTPPTSAGLPRDADDVPHLSRTLDYLGLADGETSPGLPRSSLGPAASSSTVTHDASGWPIASTAAAASAAAAHAYGPPSLHSHAPPSATPSGASSPAPSTPFGQTATPSSGASLAHTPTLGRITLGASIRASLSRHAAFASPTAPTGIHGPALLHGTVPASSLGRSHPGSGAHSVAHSPSLAAAMPPLPVATTATPPPPPPAASTPGSAAATPGQPFPPPAGPFRSRSYSMGVYHDAARAAAPAGRGYAGPLGHPAGIGSPGLHHPLSPSLGLHPAAGLGGIEPPAAGPHPHGLRSRASSTIGTGHDQMTQHLRLKGSHGGFDGVHGGRLLGYGGGSTGPGGGGSNSTPNGASMVPHGSPLVGAPGSIGKARRETFDEWLQPLVPVSVPASASASASASAAASASMSPTMARSSGLALHYGMPTGPIALSPSTAQPPSSYGVSPYLTGPPSSTASQILAAGAATSGGHPEPSPSLLGMVSPPMPPVGGGGGGGGVSLFDPHAAAYPPVDWGAPLHDLAASHPPHAEHALAYGSPHMMAAMAAMPHAAGVHGMPAAMTHFVRPGYPGMVALPSPGPRYATPGSGPKGPEGPSTAASSTASSPSLHATSLPASNGAYASHHQHHQHQHPYPYGHHPYAAHHHVGSHGGHGSHGGGHGHQQPTRSLWIGNLDTSLTSADLLHIFQPFGPIESLRILPEKECAFINYLRVEDAIAARDGMQGDRLGNAVIRVGFGKTDNLHPHYAAQALSAASAPASASTAAAPTMGMALPTAFDPAHASASAAGSGVATPTSNAMLIMMNGAASTSAMMMMMNGVAATAAAGSASAGPTRSNSLHDHGHNHGLGSHSLGGHPPTMPLSHPGAGLYHPLPTHGPGMGLGLGIGQGPSMGMATAGGNGPHHPSASANSHDMPAAAAATTTTTTTTATTASTASTAAPSSSTASSSAATGATTTPTQSLWVGNIPPSTDPLELERLFSQFGPIESARVLTHKNCGFVNFDRLADAVAARQAMHGREWAPGCTMKIGFAKVPGKMDLVGTNSTIPGASHAAAHGLLLGAGVNHPSHAADASAAGSHGGPHGPGGSSSNGGGGGGGVHGGGMAVSTGASGLSLNATAAGAATPPSLGLGKLHSVGLRHATPPNAVGGLGPHAHRKPEEMLYHMAMSGSMHLATGTLAAMADAPSAKEGDAAGAAAGHGGGGSGGGMDSVTAGDGTGGAMTDGELLLGPTQYALVTPPLPEPGPRRTDSNRLREIRKRLEASWAPHEIDAAYAEIIDEAVDLCTDYIGNVVIQKIAEHGSEAQKLGLIEKIAPYMAAIGVHKNGTWVVQKVIDTAKTPVQIHAIVTALRPFTPPLLLDQFGNYVVQCCLRLGTHRNQFVFDAMHYKCDEIAQGRFGARAMRACLESQYTTKRQQKFVAIAIVQNAVSLVMNPNGAILITWLLEMSALPGRYRVLAPKLVPHVTTLCRHKLASAAILKLVNQRLELDARDVIISELFYGGRPQPPAGAAPSLSMSVKQILAQNAPFLKNLRDVLTDLHHGVATIQKILASGCISADEKTGLADQVRLVLWSSGPHGLPALMAAAAHTAQHDPHAAASMAATGMTQPLVVFRRLLDELTLIPSRHPPSLAQNLAAAAAAQQQQQQQQQQLASPTPTPPTLGRAHLQRALPMSMPMPMLGPGGIATPPAGMPLLAALHANGVPAQEVVSPLAPLPDVHPPTAPASGGSGHHGGLPPPTAPAAAEDAAGPAGASASIPGQASTGSSVASSPTLSYTGAEPGRAAAAVAATTAASVAPKTATSKA